MDVVLCRATAMLHQAAMLYQSFYLQNERRWIVKKYQCLPHRDKKTLTVNGLISFLNTIKDKEIPVVVEWEGVASGIIIEQISYISINGVKTLSIGVEA